MSPFRSRVGMQIAGPMMVLGGVLFVLGAVAAWKVHQLQHTSDAVIAREVESMLTINELYAAMREIRYQLNLYLRSDESSHVAQVSKIHEDADRLWSRPII